mmetsp:Transcript_46548/g.122932  ORF Transcript_46548/g.122932 Transcript_46548/m.122932 type:complete len:223 (+) Transcript_46548:1039-1707(+)
MLIRSSSDVTVSVSCLFLTWTKLASESPESAGASAEPGAGSSDAASRRCSRFGRPGESRSKAWSAVSMKLVSVMRACAFLSARSALSEQPVRSWLMKPAPTVALSFLSTYRRCVSASRACMLASVGRTTCSSPWRDSRVCFLFWTSAISKRWVLFTASSDPPTGITWKAASVWLSVCCTRAMSALICCEVPSASSTAASCSLRSVPRWTRLVWLASRSSLSL